MMLTDSMLPFANHLWQSTLFVIAVWLIDPDVAKEPGRRAASVVAGCVGKVPRPVFCSWRVLAVTFNGTTSVTPPPAVSIDCGDNQPTFLGIGSICCSAGATSATQASRIPPF